MSFVLEARHWVIMMGAVINIGAEIPQLVRLNAQQRSGFPGITAVRALQ